MSVLRSRRSAAVALSAGGLFIGACGGSDSPLQQTADRLADIRSGELDFTIRLVPSGSAGVSVGLRGPFSLSGDKPLPVARIRFDRRAGQRTQATFISTGKQAFVATAGRTVRLSDDQASGLRVGEGEATSLEDLGLNIDRWIKDARTTRQRDLDRITGTLDASEALGDLARIAGRDTLGEDEAERLSRTVSGSSIEIRTGAKDRLLRRLTLSVDLAVPPELRAKTGGGSGLKVEVDLRLRDINRPVRVDPPASAPPLTR